MKRVSRQLEECDGLTLKKRVWLKLKEELGVDVDKERSHVKWKIIEVPHDSKAPHQNTRRKFEDIYTIMNHTPNMLTFGLKCGFKWTYINRIFPTLTILLDKNVYIILSIYQSISQHINIHSNISFDM